MHQLAGSVANRGYYSAMIYPPYGYGKGIVPFYEQVYNLKHVETREENLDDPDTVQVLPAGWGPDCYPFQKGGHSCIKVKGDNLYKSTKIMYWLGFTPWQLWEQHGIDSPVDLTHPNIKKMYHACQSQFCYDYLINSKLVSPELVFFLREYTHDVFMHSEEEIQNSLPQRENIVLYNPLKGPANSQAIIDVCKDLNCEFVPIQDMHHNDMSVLGMKSKIYIDFGPYPGREKIHREMAVCGCSIITGSDGCANNPIDVPSGSRKFFRQGGHYDWIAVKKQIIWDLKHHAEAVNDLHMIHYRQSVRAEKDRFENDVNHMLQTIQTYGNLTDR